MGLSLKALGRRLFDQVNVFDNGKTAFNPNPVNPRAAYEAAVDAQNRATQQKIIAQRRAGQITPRQAQGQFLNAYQQTTPIDSFVPTNVFSGAGQKVINTVGNKTIAPLALGVSRSVAGTAEGLSGLYDLATPGMGTNRFGKLATQAGQTTDTVVKQNSYNPLAYKGAQAATDVGTFVVGGGPILKGTERAGVLLSKAPGATKLVSGLDKLADTGKVGNVASRTVKFLARPGVTADILSDAARGTGLRSTRGKDVSAGSIGGELAISAGTAVGLKGAGKGVELAAKPVVTAAKNANLIRPFKLTDTEVADITKYRQSMGNNLDDETYQKGVAALNKVGIDHRDTTATDALLGKFRNYETNKPQVKSVSADFDPSYTSKPTVTLKRPSINGIDSNDPFGNKNLLTRIRNEAGSLVDDDAQMIKLLRNIEKQSGREGLVDQWMFDTGNIRASASIANSKLKNSEDFSGALKGLSKKDLNEFDDYVAARAELKNYEGLPTSRTPEQNAAIVAAGDAKFGGRFGSLNNFYKKQAQDLHDAGIISKEKLDYYNSSDDYVRIQRDMEDLVNPGFGGSRARSLGSTTANQKRSGSARDIISPTGTVPKRTQQIQLEIQRNKAAGNTLDLLEEFGLAKQVGDTKNKNTISRLVDGQRQVYEVPRDIKKVMDNVNPYQLGVIARIVSAPTRLFRAGTTALSAPFTVTNYLRDQASSALYSKSVVATHNPKNIVSGLGSAARDFAGESHSPLWKKFEEFAGDQTIYDELRNAQNTKRLLREVRRGKVGKAGNMATQPIRTLEDLNSITERATRFQNFKGIYQKTLKATGDEQEAIKAAVLAARQNSVDFQRSSSFTRALNLFIPYFNAGVQGSRNVARSFRDRPLATSMKSVGLIAAPSVALIAYNYSDEDRRKAYESINPFEKEDNFIIVGPNPKQRENGTWEGIYKIPKPQGYRELTDPARDVAEAFMKKEPVENVAGMFKDMLGGLTGPVDITDKKKFVGGLIPQAAKPWVQQGMNKDLYTGGNIVPEYMQEETDDPTKRAFKNTSGTARLIAKQLGVSPIQVEKAIRDVTGSLGRYGINASDNALANAGVIPKEQIGGRSITSDFSRRLFEASGKLLDENKTPGRRYYEDVKTVSQGLNKNEIAAFNSLHPSKTNFLGEDIFDENKRITNYTRAGAYLNNPNVLEADRKLDQLQRGKGKPGNPMFDLPKPLLTKLLLKAALPPGAKDPELSALYKESWYQDYQNARSKYYDGIKSEVAKEGKTLPKSANPYPETPRDLQKTMDVYSALPKGTGVRSNWIKANPGLWQKMTAQWAQVDAWENKERVAIGLEPIADDSSSSSNSKSKYGNYGDSNPASGGVYKYAVSLKGGNIAKPKISVRKSAPAKSVATKRSAPKVSIKKALA